MKISEAKKGLRVRLAPSVRERGYERGTYSAKWRLAGTLRSGRVIASRPPYAEGLCVYVKWDGMPTPEKWHLEDLCISTAAVQLKGTPE